MQQPGPAAATTPFRSDVAPGDAVAHPGWQRARAAVLDALARGEAAAVLGPPGSGKTLLLRDVAQTLRREGRSVRLVECPDALDPALPSAGILLVDEADRMDPDGPARLFATGVPFALAAPPGFAERLAGLPRPVARAVLEPLSPEGVARFVAARLSAAGRPRDMLDPDAVLALARHSGGLPRLVNTLAGSAVFLAEMEGASRVRRRHVDEAARLRDGADEAPAPEDHAPEPPAPPSAAGPARPVEDAAARGGGAPAPSPPAPGGAGAARRRLVAAGVAGLGLALVAGWFASGRRTVRAPGAESADAGRGAGSPGDGADGRAPPGEPGGAQRPQTPGDETSQRAEQAAPRAGEAAGAPPAAAPVRRLAPPGVPVAFRGPVYNETMDRGGQMSLVLTRRGPSDAVAARFEAWGGLLGSGDMAGSLSENGRLSLSGRLMVGKNPFDCELSGQVSGGTLTGSASFVRAGGGRVSRSRFTLTGS